MTLELALGGVPMVAAYRISGIEAGDRAAADPCASVILANLVLGDNVVPEFSRPTARPNGSRRRSRHAWRYPERRAQLEAFARLDDIMEIGKAEPAKRAAVIVEQVANEGYPLAPFTRHKGWHPAP